MVGKNEGANAHNWVKGRFSGTVVSGVSTEKLLVAVNELAGFEEGW